MKVERTGTAELNIVAFVSLSWGTIFQSRRRAQMVAEQRSSMLDGLIDVL